MCKEHVFFTKPTYSYNKMPYTCNFFSKRNILKVASYVVTYDMICIHTQNSKIKLFNVTSKHSWVLEVKCSVWHIICMQFKLFLCASNIDFFQIYFWCKHYFLWTWIKGYGGNLYHVFCYGWNSLFKMFIVGYAFYSHNFVFLQTNLLLNDSQIYLNENYKMMGFAFPKQTCFTIV
jgi:hypothetical protein